MQSLITLKKKSWGDVIFTIGTTKHIIILRPISGGTQQHWLLSATEAEDIDTTEARGRLTPVESAPSLPGDMRCLLAEITDAARFPYVAICCAFKAM